VSIPNSAVVWSNSKGNAHQIVPTRPTDGGYERNRFTAGIEASLRNTPGLYRLKVVLRDAWSEMLGAVGECVLLEQTVLVEMPEGVNSVWLLVGSLTGCAVFVGAMGLWARRVRAELRNVLVMVLTEASKTVISTSFSLGNLVTDVFTTYRVVFKDIVRSPKYRVPYAVFGCLAILVGLVSIVYQVQRAYGLRSQIKSNAIVEQEPAEISTDLNDDASRGIVRKLKWELEKASRDLKALAVRVLCLLFEDVPMVRVFTRAHRIARIDPCKT
jgi:hypothetical protein